MAALLVIADWGKGFEVDEDDFGELLSGRVTVSAWTPTLAFIETSGDQIAIKAPDGRFASSESFEKFLTTKFGTGD